MVCLERLGRREGRVTPSTGGGWSSSSTLWMCRYHSSPAPGFCERPHSTSGTAASLQHPCPQPTALSWPGCLPFTGRADPAQGACARELTTRGQCGAEPREGSGLGLQKLSLCCVKARTSACETAPGHRPGSRVGQGCPHPARARLFSRHKCTSLDCVPLLSGGGVGRLCDLMWSRLSGETRGSHASLLLRHALLRGPVPAGRAGSPRLGLWSGPGHTPLQGGDDCSSICSDATAGGKPGLKR